MVFTIKATTGVLIAMLATATSCAYADDTSDAHAHHHHMMQKTVITTADYILPNINLVRDDGKTISFQEELNDGRPVLMNFIFTTCKAVCPISSRTFSRFQDKLGADREKILMVSISIDPEQDTPARLRDYAHKYGAGPQWHFYTGTTEASQAAQKAFDVYRGDKMNHVPVTLLRSAPGKPWLRMDGFASADDLLREYRKLAAAP